MKTVWELIKFTFPAFICAAGYYLAGYGTAKELAEKRRDEYTIKHFGEEED